MGAYDVLAIIFPTIQDQSDHENERIQNTALNRVPDHTAIEGVQPMVRSEPRSVLSLLNPPDE